MLLCVNRYGLALLPSIICLGRLRIACRYIFTLWQLRRGAESLAQWLEHGIFIRTNRVRFPRQAGYFSAMLHSFFLRLSCRKMEACPGLDFTSPTWTLLRVIINDDFLAKGECYGLAILTSMICLGILSIACRYVFTLWQLRQGADSLAQWLEHSIFIRTNRVRFPRQAGYFFSYASFLCYDFRKLEGFASS